MYDHHRDCCITGGELVKAGDVPGDGEDHHRHNEDAARECVHPGLHKYQELKTSKHIWRVWKRQGMMKYQCRLWTTDMNLSAVTVTVDLLKRDAFFAHQIFVWIFIAHWYKPLSLLTRYLSEYSLLTRYSSENSLLTKYLWKYSLLNRYLCEYSVLARYLNKYSFLTRYFRKNSLLTRYLCEYSLLAIYFLKHLVSNEFLYKYVVSNEYSHNYQSIIWWAMSSHTTI